jgi:mannosyltransferase
MVLVQSHGVVRLIFALLLLSSFLLIIYNFSAISAHLPTSLDDVVSGGHSRFRRPKHGGSLKGIDPLLEPEKGPAGKLYGPGEANRTSATILSLVRNSELKDMLQSMRDLEATWNHKFNYPWTFINDEEFSKEFIEQTSKEAKYTRYGLSSHPLPPPWGAVLGGTERVADGSQR